MQRILSIGLTLVVLAGILYACSLGGGTATPETPQAAFSGETTGLELTVQAQSGTYNTVGQTIPYTYLVTNKGTTALTGPVTVNDDKTQVTCPPLNTINNLNDTLDPNEVITCNSTHSITQPELNAGSITSTATASAGGVTSNTVTTTVQMTPLKVLELTSNVNPSTYNQAGQALNFTFVIRNAGTTSLGPDQFTISDSHLGTFNCGAANISLEVNASVSCSNTYNTTEADRSANELTFNLVAVGGGATNVAAVQVKVTNTSVVTAPGNYTKGQTIKHDVQPGEWMLQITRCYGADLKAVIAANPQIKDPSFITPYDILTVPNIGSNGNIYGPPCVEFYSAQSNDTWSSIANKYNANLNVLLLANKNVALGGGVKVRVPSNSANGSPTSGQNEPVQLTLTGGKATLSGTVTVSRQKIRHVFAAVQGQTLTVTVTAPSGGLEMAVLPASGNALKAQNATLTFTGTIPSNGNYYVDVVNVTASDHQYTLDVVLTTPPVVTTSRVVDFNPGSADASPSYMTPFNNMLYFSAIGLDNYGVELYRYNPTTNSISIVKDIFSGTEGSNPSYLAEYNGALYFGANGNDGAGVELWRYNGSDAGRLTDINSNAGNANPAYMTVYNGYLYFSATGSDGFGTELYRTDGTNTDRVTDIYPGDGSSSPAYLAVYNGALYFSATSNDGYGTEIWKYDGTTSSRVTDINPNVGNANPAYLATYAGALYFSANAGDNMGTELFRYDGTSAGRAADINPGSGDSIPSYLTVFNGELYFSANGNDGKGYELWKYNGTNFSRVSDINPNGDAFPSFLSVFNNALYFQANGGDGTGKELWKYSP
jgi:ELWxxDGT repeat protein